MTDPAVPRGPIALVTGANAGLGLATASALAARGAHVILAARSAERSEQAAAHIHAAQPGAAAVSSAPTTTHDLLLRQSIPLL